jgi:hypothetical protein
MHAYEKIDPTDEVFFRVYPACDHCWIDPVTDGFARNHKPLCEDCRELCIECMAEPMIGEFKTGEEGIDGESATLIDLLCEDCRRETDFQMNELFRRVA